MQHTVLAEVNTPLQQEPAGHDPGNGLQPHMQFTAAPSFVAHAFNIRSHAHQKRQAQTRVSQRKCKYWQPCILPALRRL